MQIYTNTFPNRIEYLDSQRKWLIDYDKKDCVVYISYDRIWSVLNKEYGIEYNETQKFMKNMLLIHFKIDGITPFYLYGNKSWFYVDSFQN